VQLDAEHLLDALLEISAAPPHHAIFFSIGAVLDESSKFGFLSRSQPAGPARCFAVFKPRQTLYVIAMHPVAQRLTVHPAGFGRSLTVHAFNHQGDRQHPPCCLGIAGLG
jgi:hypothetical protein